MDKQELIDKAVEQFKGKYPAVDKGNVILSYRDGDDDKLNSYYPFYVWHTESQYDICTAGEFSVRARELGWINGYKWGVEYPTNGKRPDLPDGVVFELCDVTFGWLPFGYPKNDVHPNILENCTKFRITDLRHKPKQPEQQDKPDNSWYERGEFPPAGERCLVKISGEWLETYIIGFDDDENIVFKVDYEKFKRHYDSYNKSATENFRPIKTERDRQYEFAASKMLTSKISNTQRKTINRMLDIGFRAPDEKSCS